MAVMGFGDLAYLSPFPANKGRNIWILWVASKTVTLLYRIYAVAPLAVGETLGVIGEKVKVELGDKACIVAGIGWRVSARGSVHHRQAVHKGVCGISGVHMGITKEYLLVLVDGQCFPSAGLTTATIIDNRFW